MIYSKRHNKFLFPALTRAIYESFRKVENKIYNVVNYNSAHIIKIIRKERAISHEYWNDNNMYHRRTSRRIEHSLSDDKFSGYHCLENLPSLQIRIHSVSIRNKTTGISLKRRRRHKSKRNQPCDQCGCPGDATLPKHYAYRPLRAQFPLNRSNRRHTGRI